MMERLCVEIILISLILQIIELILPPNKIGDLTKFVVMICFLNFVVKNIIALIGGIRF